jgi:hypothetical protein
MLPSYGHSARMRLAVSLFAAAASDVAAAMVPTVDDRVAIAMPNSLPPHLPPGWHVTLARGRMVGLAMPAGWWWNADAATVTNDLPPEWLALARPRNAIIVLAGTLALAGNPELGFEPVPPNLTMTVITRAMARGQLAGGIVALVETP